MRARNTGTNDGDISQWRAREKFDLVVWPGGPSVPGRSRLREGHREHGRHVPGAFLYVEAVTARDCGRSAIARGRTPGSSPDPRLSTVAPSRVTSSRSFAVFNHVRGGDKVFYDLERALAFGRRMASTKHGELEIPPLGERGPALGWSGPAPRSS